MEGETTPVSESTVQTWQDFLYARVDDSRVASLPSNLEDALKLLRFSDFAGTCRPALRELSCRIADDRAAFLELSVDAQYRVRLQLHNHFYYHGNLGLMERNGAAVSKLLVPDEVYKQHKERFRASVAAALEGALYVAARLDLVPLIRNLRSFVRSQLLPGINMVLEPGAIYTPRVLQNLSAEAMREGFLESSLDTGAFADLRGPCEVEATFKSELAASWFRCAPWEKTAGCSLGEGRHQRGFLEYKGGVLTFVALLGGLDTESREALVRKALDDVAAAEAR